MQDERGAGDSGLECFFSALAGGFFDGRLEKEKKDVAENRTHQGQVHDSDPWSRHRLLVQAAKYYST